MDNGHTASLALEVATRHQSARARTQRPARQRSGHDEERPPEPIGVVIVDDHAMVAEGLSQLLRGEPDIAVLGHAATIADGISLIESTRPRVVIMDYHLPDGNGGTATGTIRTRWPEIEVIMLTGSGADEALAIAISAGCAGYIEKTLDGLNLAEAVRSVAQGDLVIHAGRLHGAAPSLQAPTRVAKDLTRRELEVLQLLAEGQSVHAIGEALFLSRNTIRNHIQNLLTKLGAHSKLEAVALAMRTGIIEVETH